MANLVGFFKVVASLPSNLEPNAFYAVRSGSGFDFVLTDSTGGIAHHLNITAEQAVINTSYGNRLSAVESKVSTNASAITSNKSYQDSKNSNYESRLTIVESKAATNTTTINNLVTSDNAKVASVTANNATVTVRTGAGSTSQFVINNVTNATYAAYASNQGQTDRSTHIANTEYVRTAIDELFEKIYPIGIIVEITQDPNQAFSGMTWTMIDWNKWMRTA